MEGSGRGVIEALFKHLLGGTEDNHGEPVRIADVPAEVRTEHLPYTSLQRYF
jgi:hypothetical protein